MNETQRFISSTIGGIVCIVLAVLAYAGDPPILALGDPLRVLLLVAGIGAFGIQVMTALPAVRASAASKVGK